MVSSTNFLHIPILWRRIAGCGGSVSVSAVSNSTVVDPSGFLYTTSISFFCISFPFEGFLISQPVSSMGWKRWGFLTTKNFLLPISSCRFFSAKTSGSIEGIKDIIAVASGKGGVGKSTTAVNVAVALAKKCQLKVGLLDADIYGPSIPTMMNLYGKPEVSEDMKMIPMGNHGVKCMSIGFLVEKDAPVVWRGPMVMSALEKMTRGVSWGKLDILVVDMPPGTGDAQLSISQRLKLSGALIVSTPQDVALIDARRGANMFRKVDVPILGLIENMSSFKCPHCGEQSYIFGNGGAHRTADEMSMEFLGKIPLEMDIRTSSDEGNPVVISSIHSEASKAYSQLADRIVEKLSRLENEQKSCSPQILL